MHSSFGIKRQWHYCRAIPKRYAQIDERGGFSAHERYFDGQAESRRNFWSTGAGVGRGSDFGETPCQLLNAIVQRRRRHGLCAKPSEMISDQELLERLRLIFAGSIATQEQPAVLGLVEQPE